MKTHSIRIAPVTKEIPRLAPATARGIETLPLMKTRLPILKLLVVWCVGLATPAVFGQTIYTWTNCAATDIGLAADWNPNGLPSGAPQDTAQWDGVCPGNLALTYTTGWGNSGFGTSGVNLGCTVNQVGNVTITGPAAGSPAAGIFGITNNSATAVFHLGNGGTTNLLNLATRPGNAGTVHGFVNNSANAAIMDSSIAWVAGGGVACVMDFSGTGDWIVNHNLRQNNSGAGPITVNWAGPGTLTWSPGGVWLASDAIGPITINGGTVILKGAGLCPSFTIFTSGTAPGNNTITNNGTLLKYDAAAADTIDRVILGTGALQVNNGVLTLSGANVYSGNTLLSGGELVVGGAETAGVSGPLGTNGTISFAGGTLGFSGANTFDYSSRFSAAPGQLYSFDTAAQSVTLATGLGSSGATLTKLGAGTLTLAGATTYSGLTTISVGTLSLQGTKSGSGNITVADSADLAITENGGLVAPAALAFGSGSILEFNNVTNHATATLAPGTVSATGPVTINVNSGHFFSIGETYPLLTWTNGSAPAVTLGTLAGAGGHLTTNGNTLQVVIDDPPYIWTGLTNGTWDTSTTNWVQSGVPRAWANGHYALLDDTGAATNVTMSGVIVPVNVTVANSSLQYTISSTPGNVLGGSASLTKNNNGLLTLSGGVNAYTGVTTINGGTVSVAALANGGVASDLGAANNSATNLVLNGGTLLYTGGAAGIDRLFSLGTSGGTIDASGSGPLNWNNSGSIGLSGSGPRLFTLTGNLADANTLASRTVDSSGGATALTKGGTGTWIVTGTNAYSGGTTIASGLLQVGTGGTGGSLGSGNVLNNSVIDFVRTGNLTVSGAISGSGSVTNDGSGTVILAGNNSYTGGTTINAGTLQVGNGGATGRLDAGSPIANSGTIIFNSTSDATISGVISGTGQLIKRGSGLLKFIGANTYTGGTTIDAGAQLQIWQGNTGANASSAITNNGTLIMMRQDLGIAIYAGPISGTGKVVEQVSNGNFGDSTLTGTNTYSGGTYILGGGIILGDNGTTPFGGSIVGNVFLTNDYIHATFGPFIAATLTFNRAEAVTFSGNIVGDGNVAQNGLGTLTLTGVNTYTNGTTVNAGALQVGNGGATGSVGSGPVALNSGAPLVINRSGSLTIPGIISGAADLETTGPGTVTLNGTNTYSGTNGVLNGTLIINADNAALSTYVHSGGSLGGNGTLVGPVTLEAGTTLAPGASIGTLTITSDLSIGGNLAIEVNKAVSPSNDLVAVSGVLTNTGTGTLTVANLGPPLAVGDKFTLFSQSVSNGAALTVTGAGANWANNLAVDGSISVSSLVPRPTLIATQIGNSLQFSWTGSFKLLAQTNSLSNKWSVYPGGGTSPVTIPIDKTNKSVFYGLAPKP